MLCKQGEWRGQMYRMEIIDYLGSVRAPQECVCIHVVYVCVCGVCVHKE